MTMTKDNATTWRDLADQLTPEQRDSLSKSEARFAASGIAERQEAINANLGFARDFVERNHIDVQFAHVPVPAGASLDSATNGPAWEKNLMQGGWSRSLVWRTFETVDGAAITIDGRQESDGTFTRSVRLWGIDEGGDLSSEHARAIAALLVQAADELDRLQ